jgi:AraC family transcriptional regulator of adaptative response / DNA-3-methyladenine glycosylase II
MERLDDAVCDRARLARDPRFDGQFFIAVRSTGIYCRPVCPAPTVKRANVLFFPSSSAAVAAGFRPCLRCRPEVAPGAPPWNGTAATVSRALRLIGEGALDDRGIEALSGRLGIGVRQLARLFRKHLGAPPTLVAQTRRLEFAKQLVSETGTPMKEVALAAGFRSVRRFNDAFRKFSGRSPSEVRSRPTRDRLDKGQYLFRLAYRAPYDWESLLAFLAARATPGVEEVTGTYRRTFWLEGQQGILEVEPVRGVHALEVRIRFPEARLLLQIVTRVSRMFDLTADPVAIERHLSPDPLLGNLVRGHPGLRLPGAWDGFELAVRAILGQQVTVAGASTLAGRLAQRWGEPLEVDREGGLSHVFPRAEHLLDAPFTGLPAARARAIRELARAVVSGRVSLDGSTTSVALREELTAVPGIGEWTASYIAMRAFNDPDAFPVGDLVLRREASQGEPLTPRQLAERAEAWRPWRAYAALHLWRGAASRGLRRASATTKMRRRP